MPRPTAAQLAYGSATVVLSTLAMLLMSETRSVLGIVSISLAGLALGLFVAVTVPAPRAARRPGVAQTAPGSGARGAAAARPAEVVRAEAFSGRAARPRARAGVGSGIGEHSGHR
ncbi:hypothetical protein [Streptomyces lycii]|uniref:Uncharacterized protein n=1 Tax=Streptomyces lycii TaxID=2654337 RepID=A0ABQ7FL40_9ACTN|nr:hypothetical protein [Streptomyces lycii]KAF4409662.1 hypothetical protein GCU69_07845 [Streptomyces lycii]